MKKLGLNAWGMLALLASATAAEAAVIQVDHVLDPAIISTVTDQELLASAFTAGVGDTIAFNLSFAGGPISLSGDSYLWLLSVTNDDIAGIDTSYSWEFLSPSANLVAGPITGTQPNQQIHVGTYLASDQYRLNNAPISFSGIRLTVNLLSLYDVDTDEDGTPDTPSLDPRTYETIGLSTTGTVGAVPELATWLMLVAGIGMIGGALRLRQERTPRPA